MQKNQGMSLPACVMSAVEIVQSQGDSKACSTSHEIQSPTPPLGA